MPPSKSPTPTPNRDALDLARRLEQAIELTGDSASAVALRAGLARGSLGNTIRLLRAGEKSTVTAGTLAAVAKATNVDPAWLTTGAGVPRPEKREGVATGSHPDWPEVVARLQKAHRDLPPLAFDEVASRVLCDPSEQLDEQLVADLARAWYRRASRAELRAADTRSVAGEVDRARSGAVERSGTKR